MGAIFSHHRRPHGPPKVRVTDHDRAVLDLKTAKDRLKRYQVKMRAESSRLQEKAKELVQAGRKDRALLVLKMRRLREEECQKADGQLLNVEKLISQIEWETEQLKVFDALKVGNRVLEDIHKIMSIEAVEQLMADTQDSIEYEQEVSRLLSANLSSVSEEEVLAEFQALEAAAATGAPATLVEPGAAPVPATAAAAATRREEEAAAPAPAPAPAPAAAAPAAATIPELAELPEVPTHKLPVIEQVQEAEAAAGEGAAEEEAPRRQEERVAVMG